MMATYWEIGRRIVESEQQGQQQPEYSLVPTEVAAAGGLDSAGAAGKLK